MAHIGVKVILVIATCISSTVCDTQTQTHASKATEDSPELYGKAPNIHCSCNCAVPAQTDRQTCDSVGRMQSDLHALLAWKGAATNLLHHLKNSLQMVNKSLDDLLKKGCSPESSLVEDIIATHVKTIVLEEIDHRIREATEHVIFRVKGPDPLGVESGQIPDTQISASSEVNSGHGPRRARLYAVNDGDGTGAWCAKHNDGNQWLQVDLRKPTEIQGVVTQGRFGHQQWVETYKLQFGTDGDNWWPYTDASGRQKVFQGNVDSNTPQRHLLADPVTARYVRFRILTWNNHICMRMEVLGNYN
ncbi:adipocyte enhancer-binding protein 1-like [Branchiostoma floridae]|uniref:Adipocyte enhancer-binding protein 1-like n=1 Tax=Branchiostoma floridae TaxID=7739 RepID=A0A9J7M1M3_BRAFL|nr:adipocyte enhancer-binding protein 1-like [Branchiostoma floridae]